ncbi:MAG: hypothetical protein JSR45_00700 [Proteobacteria bacterium]|nr:hypothetical protein [Pseudomonadota bacterium]
MSQYDGMTVNERLGTAELFEAWDAAVRAKDRMRMITLLQSVDMTADQAASTTDTVLSDPAFYGYLEGEAGPPRVPGDGVPKLDTE